MRRAVLDRWANRGWANHSMRRSALSLIQINVENPKSR